MFSDDFFADSYFPSFFPPDTVTAGPPPSGGSAILRSSNFAF